jgi:hypothetical protein
VRFALIPAFFLVVTGDAQHHMPGAPGTGQGNVIPLGQPLPPIGPIPALGVTSFGNIVPSGPPTVAGTMPASHFAGNPAFGEAFTLPINPGTRFVQGRTGRRAYFGGYGGYGYGGWAYAYGSYAPSVTNIVVVEASQEAPLPPPPSPPARSEVREYKFPQELIDAAPGTPKTFAILLNSGARLEAVAIWIQGDELRYVDENSAPRRVPLAVIDRQATKEANAARNLSLQIP